MEPLADGSGFVGMDPIDDVLRCQKFSEESELKGLKDSPVNGQCSCENPKSFAHLFFLLCLSRLASMDLRQTINMFSRRRIRKGNS